MSKQLLLYKNLMPVNKERHGDWSVEANEKYDFAQGINSVPLTAVEFPAASDEYPIVFTKSNDGVMPIVVVGVRPKENVFINAEGYWEGKYIPAFIRRYPFVFSTGDEGKTLTLCLDEGYEKLNQEGKGERLFNEQGEKSEYTQKVLDFLQEFQGHFQRTQIFGKKLDELGLLEPMGAKFKTPEGEERTLNGFFAVNRDKLKEVPAEKLQELVKTDEMELVYLHLASMKNLNEVIRRMPAQAEAPAEA